MPDCATCMFFELESQDPSCLHVNRPGGLTLTEEAVDLCQLPCGARIVDIACGTGTSVNYLQNLRNLNAIGVDLSQNMLRLGNLLYPNLRLVQADGGSVPLADQSCDAVMVECALSLAGNPDVFTNECRRLLKPQGNLIVSDVYLREANNNSDTSLLSNVQCLSGVMAEAKIGEIMRNHGFEIKHWQDRTHDLKKWLGQMIFKSGSLDSFFCRLFGCSEKAESAIQHPGRDIKLGYYLLIAQKQELSATNGG